MALYVTRCALTVNGKVIDDFKSFIEKARIIRKKVPLMYKSGTAQLTQRYEVEVDYVVPQTNPYSFDAIEGGTLSVEFDSGTTVDFGGVAVAEIGDATIDGENELVRKIRLIAETRNGNSGATDAA
jgi:hypothetical protein